MKCGRKKKRKEKSIKSYVTVGFFERHAVEGC